MSKYTKAHYNEMTEELAAQLNMLLDMYVANVKSCFSCVHKDVQLGQCYKLSELTKCNEYTEGVMICEYYDRCGEYGGVNLVENLYGWYEVCEEDEVNNVG